MRWTQIAAPQLKRNDPELLFLIFLRNIHHSAREDTKWRFKIQMEHILGDTIFHNTRIFSCLSCPSRCAILGRKRHFLEILITLSPLRHLTDIFGVLKQHTYTTQVFPKTDSPCRQGHGSWTSIVQFVQRSREHFNSTPARRNNRWASFLLLQFISFEFRKLNLLTTRLYLEFDELIGPDLVTDDVAV